MRPVQKIITWIFLLHSITLCSQKPIIKTITEIRTNYNSDGTFWTDTLRREFDSTGKAKSEFSWSKTITSVYSRTITSSPSSVHRRIFFDDSTFEDEHIQIYRDSFTLYRLINLDTSFKRIEYHKKGKTLKSVFIAYSSSYSENYHSITFKRRGWQEHVSQWRNSEPETTKIKWNRIFRTQKELAFNPDKKRWYRSRKERCNSIGLVTSLFEKKYDKGEKTYFKEWTKYRYDENRKVIEKKKYDYFRVLAEKASFTYTYY